MTMSRLCAVTLVWLAALVAWLVSVASASADFGFRVSDVGSSGPAPPSASDSRPSNGPWTNWSTGYELATTYIGPAGPARLLEGNLASPTALASADFDEDGVPDVICGYVGPGGGMVTLHRGNVAALWPSERVGVWASGRVGEEWPIPPHSQTPTLPFLPAARVFALPEAPEFLGAGDFNADGHWDVVAAARSGNALNLLPGDGRGGFGDAQRIELPGTVTALITGEINRRDGLEDVIVGVVGADGPQALVFEGPEGAVKTQPESIALSAEARALALGQLDEGFEMDLAIAAGSQLVLVPGRDRSDFGLEEAAIDRLTFPSIIAALAVGDFIADETHRTDVALVDESGSLHLVEQGKGSHWKPRESEFELPNLKSEIRNPKSEIRLVRTKVSSFPTDDLLVMDGGSHQLHLLSDLRPDDFGFRISDFGLEENLSPSAIRHPPSAMAAVLPMRLNVDALDDLVILREESTAPAVVMTAPMATFTVNSTLDAPDSTPGDGTCCTGFVLGNCLGVCTLRAAIQEANASPGTDAIVFNIIGAGPHTIQPTSPLPTITDPVTLDGTTDPDGGGMINLNGSQAGVAHGLVISAGSSVVRGLAISGFHLLFTDPDGGTGIRITTAGSNIIEGNHIGPDAAGAPVGNLGNGIEIIDSPNNLIGGATAAARNVISLNGFFSFTHGGLFISGGSAGGNRVQGNYIGVGPTGAAAMPNNEDGVHISGAPNNTIGGTSPGARNVISGNEEGDPFFDCGVGVVIVETSGTLVQGNYIGTDADGEAALGNGADGVFVGSPSNTIGGTTPSARNVISGNRLAGVEIHGLGASINRVQGNYIGINADGSAALGNGHGVYLLAANNTIGGTAAGAGNVISGNGLNGVTIAGSTVSDNRVEGNYIGTDPTGSAALGNGAHGVAIGVFVGGVGTIGAPDNIIGGTDPQAGNIISGNALNGVEIGGGSSTGNVVQGNYIGTDKNGVSALKNHHNGVLITSGASENTIGGTDSGAGNTIAFNGTIGVFVQSSASTGNAILGNAIFSNTGLGIDLWPGGVTFNELGDADTGANNLQNFPTIDWISNSGGLTTVNLDLHSLANTMFRIEVFAVAACDLQGHGEGQTFLAAATVTTNGTGEASFTTSFPTPAGQFFTATATNLNTNDTSEFSACAQACRMTCPTNIDKTTGPGQCGTTVNYPALTTGACGGVVCTPPSGAFFSKGVTTVTCNTSTGLGCSFTVTVSDHQDPTVSCPANITQPAAPNQCGATVNFSAGFADNCPGVTGSCSPPPSAFFPVGVTTVVCTATDAAGRRASCSFTVTVTNTPPTANAGTDQKAVEGKTVTLNSSGSRDPEGQTLASQWTQTGGPPVTLNNAQTATPSFTAPLVPDGACQSLVFQLTVTDPCGLGATDTVVITISDGYLLLDDRSGSCLELFTCDHTYEFYDGSTRYSGPAIITATSARVAFQSAADGPNYLTGTIDLTTRRGSARYQVPRGGSTIKSIFDSNIDNNPAACP